MKSQEGGLLLIACLQAFVTLIAAQVSIEQPRRKKSPTFCTYCCVVLLQDETTCELLSTVESHDHRCSTVARP